MSVNLNWLHLTDLHFGLDAGAWLWPRLKDEFLQDVRLYTERFGPLDVVFFTGDLTQRGEPSEFDALSRELELIWREISGRNQPPLLFPVPGNHDLQRPAEFDPTARDLTTQWSRDPALREEFWRNADCEHRNGIRTYFKAYENWLKSAPVPLPPRRTGILPGDFSSTVTKDNITLGIVGLNTTFLQIAKGDFKGRLDLHVSQLNAVCEGDPHPWLEAHTASVLLTHHPPSWLSPSALNHFRSDIFPPGRFIAHLCGHQHEPDGVEASEGGGATRRTRLGPSLFGLEKWEGGDSSQRIHGYHAGQYTFDTNQGIDTLWPRIALKAKHGALRLKPDHTFELQDECLISTFAVSDEELPAKTRPVAGSTESATTERPELISIDEQVSSARSRSELSAYPRLKVTTSSQHSSIRSEEQTQLEEQLRSKRFAWVIADWGVGRDEFLGVVLPRMQGGKGVEIFHLRCDEAPDLDTLLSSIRQQFGMLLQELVHVLAGIVKPILLFDGIHPAMTAGQGLKDLIVIRDAVVDFCPDILLLFSSRTTPGLSGAIELRPLDEPDVRNYVTNHPDSSAGLRDPDVVSKLHEHSDGLPMHLDRMLESLRISTLEEVIEAELNRAIATDYANETPKALIDAVATFSRSPDRASRRSYRLLQVLSVLPYGETLDRIKRYLPAEPFFPDNALQLASAALLDIVPLQQPRTSVPNRTEHEVETPRLLKVPRQVRDYILSAMTADEHRTLVEAGAERLLGPKWREGVLRLRSVSVEYREFAGAGPGNEYAILHVLINSARDEGDLKQLKKLLKIGISYATNLSEADRYRDAIPVTRALLQVTDRREAEESWCVLASIQGRCLRMIPGKEVEAARFLREALDGDRLPRSAQAQVWLNLAHIYKEQENAEDGIAAALEVKGRERPGTGLYCAADAIQVGLELQGTDRTARLMAIERDARDKKYEITALNINLQLAYEASSAQDKLAILERTPLPKQSGYSQSRLIVALVAAVQSVPSVPRRLRLAEVAALHNAYTYLYTQRFNTLFDACHRALWTEIEQQKDTQRLARLFRFSSFVWRIRGEDELERMYAEKLQSQELPTVTSAGSQWEGLRYELNYFWRRAKLIVVRLFVSGDDGT